MVRAQRLMKLQPYLDMVKHSRLLAPNLKEMVLHTYSKKHPSNDVAREIVKDHLLALRWMNPHAKVYLRESRGMGEAKIYYTLWNGESHTIHLGTKYDADETVGNLLWVARDPAVQDPTAEQQQADAGAGAGGVAAPLE